MSPSLVSKILLAVAIIILIGTAYSMNRGYQDSWGLEGLEIPYVLFVLTFAAAFFLEKRILWRVALAVVGRVVFTLIPAVKYTWFLGQAIDQNIQYDLAKTVYTTGHIAAFSPAGLVYVETPLQHLSYSMFSSLVNVSIVSSMKFLPVFWTMLYPLLIYIIVKNMHFAEETTVLGYALFISSFPLAMIQYLVSGSLFGAVLVQFVLTLIVLTYFKHTRLYLIVLFFSVLALAAAHSLSSLILAGSLLIVLLITRFSRLVRSPLSFSKVLAIASIALAWLLLQAGTTFQTIINIFFVEVPTGSTPPSESIMPAFFSLLRINPLAAARSFIVIYGATAFFLILTFAGLLVMLRMRKQLSKVSKFLAIFCSSVLVIMVVGFFIKAGWARLLTFAMLLFPIFSAIFILKIGKKTRFRRIIVGAVFFIMIFLATIEFYGYQPLIPSANILYPGLPSNVPTSQVGLVNTIYQRQMIYFAGEHISGKIATIFPIDTQIVGLLNESYAGSHVILYNPFDESQQKLQYDYFLINMPSQYDVLGVAPQLRNPNVIGNYLSNGTLVYSNGESYVMESPPHLSP